MERFVLKLYVSGQTPKSCRQILSLRRICEEELAGRYELAVINVLERPQVMAEGKIFATPTLVKQLPPPVRRIIGDLFDKEKVLAALDITPNR